MFFRDLRSDFSRHPEFETTVYCNYCNQVTSILHKDFSDTISAEPFFLPVELKALPAGWFQQGQDGNNFGSDEVFHG